MESKGQKLKGGLSDKKSISDIAKKHKVSIEQIKTQITKGRRVEREHTKDSTKATEIVMDHLWEDPKYYDKLKKIENKEATSSSSAGSFAPPMSGMIKRSIKEALTKSDFQKAEEVIELIKKEDPDLYRALLFKVIDMYTSKFGDIEDMVNKSKKVSSKSKDEVKKIAKRKEETKEATGSDSSGSYETPAAWAKSTTKKDWRGKRKTQIPGGKFVTIKKKCKNFPYCNQGDIKALKIYENIRLKNIINSVSKKYNVPVEVIKSVIQNEIEIKRNKSIN